MWDGGSKHRGGCDLLLPTDALGSISTVIEPRGASESQSPGDIQVRPNQKEKLAKRAHTSHACSDGSGGRIEDSYNKPV